MAEYIEREATIKLLKSLGSRDYRREKGTIADAIKMLSHPAYTPAADVVEVKRGRWIVDEYDSGEPNGHSAFVEFHCPFCNEPYTLESGEYNWYYGDDIPLKFCHECGADMRGDGDA